MLRLCLEKHGFPRHFVFDSQITRRKEIHLEKKRFLEAAKVINTHGVAGEVKLENRTDGADILKKLPVLFIDGNEYKIARARVIPGGFVLAKLDGIDDLDEALKLKGKLALARREDIPKKDGAHFIADMIGLPVIDKESGEIYGTLDDVEMPAVQEIYCVRTPSGSIVRIPNVPEFIKEIDEERGIFISVIDGFFGEVDDEI